MPERKRAIRSIALVFVLLFLAWETSLPLAAATGTATQSDTGTVQWIAAITLEGNIQLVRPDGEASRAVTEDATNVLERRADQPTLLYLAPQWSPDGRYLAFLRQDDGSGSSPFDYSLLLHDPASAQTTTLVSRTGDSFDWGPKGERIVLELPSATALADPDDPLSMTWDEYGGLMLVDVATGERRALVQPQNEAPLEDPNWAPDGSHLIFHDEKRCYDYCSHSIGSAAFQEPIASYEVWDPDIHGFQPTCDWSPDSKRVACVDAPFFLGPDCPVVLYTAQGALLRELPNSDPSCDQGPLWSPDGSAIAVGAAVSGDDIGRVHRYVDLLSPDGSERRRLVEGRPLDWSPNGRQIVGVHDYTLFVVEVETGGITWLIEGKDAAWQPAPLPEPTPEPSATPTGEPATPSPEPTALPSDPTSQIVAGDPPTDPEAGGNAGPLGPFFGSSAWAIGLTLGGLALLMALGLTIVLLATRDRPSRRRRALIGYGLGVGFLSFVAALAVANVLLDPRWWGVPEEGSALSGPTATVQPAQPTGVSLAEGAGESTATVESAEGDPVTPIPTTVPPTATSEPPPTSTPFPPPTDEPSPTVLPTETPTPTAPPGMIVDNAERYTNDASLRQAYTVNDPSGTNGCSLSLERPSPAGNGNQAIAFTYAIPGNRKGTDDYCGFETWLSTPQDWSAHSQLCLWVDVQGPAGQIVVQFEEGGGQRWKNWTWVDQLGRGMHCLRLSEPPFCLTEGCSQTRERIDLGAIRYYGIYINGREGDRGVMVVDAVRVR